MFYPLARSLIFKLNPERAHDFILQQLKMTAGTPFECLYRQKLPSRPVELMGLKFDNPVGLAAGLDKNGDCIDGFGAMGFGFIELGTVTPKPQDGNPKPRLFRILEGEGIINRMGFNNKGVDYLVEQVKKASYKGVIGINIGKNLTTPVEQGKDDYLTCMTKAFEHASYIAVNISSPNTPGLRSLQYGEMLDDLLKDLMAKKAELSEHYDKHTPLCLKIAPDLSEAEIEQIADSVKRHKLDGVIATNTTLSRDLVAGMQYEQEAGGLSGRPVQNISTQVIKSLHSYLQDEIPIIGVGGIDSVVAGREKMAAGAKLVQIYSGFIYKGPDLIKDLVKYM